jgi:hypothetical protein
MWQDSALIQAVISLVFLNLESGLVSIITTDTSEICSDHS